MIYCRTCDLGFCGSHIGAHETFNNDTRREHDMVDAREMIQHIPCCICDGIVRIPPEGS